MQRMTFEYRPSESLPRLSWCAVVRRSTSTVTVCHGPWVEHSDRFFCEGAWAGEFAAAAFASAMFTGTGGLLTTDGVVFSCPNHTLDRLFVKRTENTVFISNSLAFILAETADELNPGCLFYGGRLASIRDGLNRYVRSIKTRKGSHIELYYHCNLRVTDDLSMQQEPKPRVPAFSDFEHYSAFLRQQIKSIAQNATDSARLKTYTPLTTISSGYDSAAAAALASEVGCRQAVSFAHARGTNRNNDSGAHIAQRLGLQVTVLDRLDFQSREDFPEAETFGPSEFAVLDPFLQGRLVFTGFHGGKLWDRNVPTKISSHIVRGDASGASLTEHRLRVGWFHLPVAFLGCTSQPSIVRISRSEQMRPWSLMNRYDKPIPRRILEEHGVDREMFGQRKRAVGIWVTEEGLKRTMTAKSQEDFRQFCRTHWNAQSATKAGLARLVRALYSINHKFNRLIAIGVRVTTGKNFNLPVLIPQRIRYITYSMVGRESLLFHWGMDKLIKRYNGCSFNESPRNRP